MTSPSRALRTSTLATAAAAAMLVLTGPAALAANNGDAVVEVAHDCTSIDVSSTKDISNVVLEFADGDIQRFEDLPERRTGTFAGTGDDHGEIVTTAWIKSGNNTSGDGPGYGERFDFDTTACQDGQPRGAEAAATATTDDGDTGDENDETTGGAKKKNSTNTSNHEGVADADADVEDSDGEDVVKVSSAGGDDVTGAETSSDTDDQQTAETGVVGSSLDDTDTAAIADDQQVPPARVLSAGLERDAGSGMQAAAASEVRSAQQLPTAGADIPVGLAAALAALALGGWLLQRTRRSAA